MYLVHIVLAAAAATALPDRVRELIGAAALPDERVEHVAVHPQGPGRLVVGVYLLADRLEEAEHRAAALCRRVLEASPEFQGWWLASAGVPLVAPFYEQLVSSSGLGGRIGPGPFQAS